MSNIETITLNGTELKVEGLGGQNTIIINRGSATLYASAYANVVPDGDNAAAILPGGAMNLHGTNGTVYLLGMGKVQLWGTDIADLPIALGGASGGGGSAGSGVSQEYVDSADAVTLLSAKKYTDVEIASVREEIPVIPEALPADGGSADTAERLALSIFCILRGRQQIFLKNVFKRKEIQIMKKIGAFFTSLALALCLTACSNNENSGGGISAPSLIQSNSTISSSSTSSSISSTNTGSSEASSSSEESSDSESISESSSESTESIPGSSAPVESSEPKQSSSEPTSSESAAPVQSEPEAQPEPVPEEDKTLVVYFTWSSNTAGMAETIADLTGADTFEIVPIVPYPEEYTPCTEVALEERDNNARPEIQNLPASVAEYDNILIGYPIWWHTAPMIIGTFLENYDLTGIDVYPFTQSASMNAEQFEQSMDFVRGCAGSATVHDGLFTRPSDTDAITSYLEQNGLTKQMSI